MKEPGKKYNDEENMSSTTCVPSSARLAAKHLLPSIILWWKETGELDNVLWKKNRTEHHVQNTESM